MSIIISSGKHWFYMTYMPPLCSVPLHHHPHTCHHQICSSNGPSNPSTSNNPKNLHQAKCSLTWASSARFQLSFQWWWWYFWWWWRRWWYWCWYGNSQPAWWLNAWETNNNNNNNNNIRKMSRRRRSWQHPGWIQLNIAANHPIFKLSQRPGWTTSNLFLPNCCPMSTNGSQPNFLTAPLAKICFRRAFNKNNSFLDFVLNSRPQKRFKIKEEEKYLFDISWKIYMLRLVKCAS